MYYAHGIPKTIFPNERMSKWAKWTNEQMNKHFYSYKKMSKHFYYKISKMSKWVNELNAHMSKFVVKWAPVTMLMVTPGCTMSELNMRCMIPLQCTQSCQRWLILNLLPWWLQSSRQIRYSTLISIKGAFGSPRGKGKGLRKGKRVNGKPNP